MPKAFNLRTRTSRRLIPEGKALHITKLHKGLALGYRRGVKGGTWIGRIHESGTKYAFQPLGIADDAGEADGARVLTFDQAQDAARAWAKRKAQEDAGEVSGGPYTVAQAMEDYFCDRERAKRRKMNSARTACDAHIIPALGHLDLTKLTHSRLKGWRDAVAAAPPRRRTKKGKTQEFRSHDPQDADALRRRQATANRILSTLKAALNYAHDETKRIASRAAWTR